MGIALKSSDVDGLFDLKIAVDFDGTIVEHAYPGIGKEKLFAFSTLRELQKRGAKLILWTFRTGQELEEAVEFCRQNGVEFYAVNKNYPEEVYDESAVSRKIDVDIYIDDKNLGGFPGWSAAWQMLFPYEAEEEKAKRKLLQRGNIFRKIFMKKKKADEEKLP